MKAHELLSDESRWTKGWFAIKADGSWACPSDSDACRYCMIGAIINSYPDETTRSEIYAAIDRELGLTDPEGATKWNDAPERAFAEVHDLLVKLDI